jgi:hypothetical protein
MITKPSSTYILGMMELYMYLVGMMELYIHTCNIPSVIARTFFTLPTSVFYIPCIHNLLLSHSIIMHI